MRTGQRILLSAQHEMPAQHLSSQMPDQTHRQLEREGSRPLAVHALTNAA